MSQTSESQFKPDFISPPGETLEEILQTKGMSQSELAERTGRTPKTINEIIKGKLSIGPETALQLERVFSIPASFWNNRQRRYDEYLAQQQEKHLLSKQLEWSQCFPYKKMAEMGWVTASNDKIEQLKNLLNYFGVASPQAWESYWGGIQVSYRKSDKFEADEYALAAWLRKGEEVGHSIDCEIYNEGAFKSTLNEVRKLTVLPASEFQKNMISLCAKAGVAVAFVRELPKTASGATRWLSPNKALIQLSLRYKTDDHLWFTFFHEAAHILRHQKKGIFIEGNSHGKSEEENEANRFATEFLIPVSEWKRFDNSRPITKAAIRDFASLLEIAPGIVVGQLQHHLEWLQKSHCNDLKLKLKWKN